LKKKIKIYLLGGQSNMCGVAPVEDLPPELREPQHDVIIFARGELDAAYNGQFGWASVKPDLGAWINIFGPEITFARDISAANPGEQIALIKCAWGGTNLQFTMASPRLTLRSILKSQE
jgi:iduronate 2-sulfatase